MSKSKTALGVQLDTGTARLVLVENGDNGLRVLTTQQVAVGEELARAFKSLPRRPSEVVCSVRLADSAIRILDLPPTVEDNLERVVALEAETALPLQASDLAIAHHVLGMTEQSRLEVLLAAARQSAVQDALHQVNCVSWISATGTPSASALFNALQHVRGAEREPVCAILRVEADWSELLVIDRNRIIVAQAIPLGCGVTAGARAEPVAAGAGTRSALTMESLPWVTTLAQQVRYSLQAVSYERGFSIQRLYVCGEGVTREGSEWQLSERLDVPITLLGPPGGEPHEAAQYAVAFGCALQGVGVAAMPLRLALARVTVAREVEQRRQVRISWGALIGSVVIAGSLVVGAMFHQQNQRLAKSEATREQLKLVVAAPAVPPEELKAARTAITESLETRIPAAQVLSTLSRQLPEGTWLNELTYNPTTGCVLRGYSMDANGAQRAQIALLRQQLFDEVTLDYRTEDEVSGAPVWGFQLTCRMRPKEVTRTKRSTRK
jgi:Tfp pilus assembly PilM family ATPase/Tfp pilus assembly protein PilN